uniref:Uncharacterized protein n=1 Tax=Anguilla anguilla TaxID=7936 RepID=A0A0E9TSQ9_ANGAN
MSSGIILYRSEHHVLLFYASVIYEDYFFIMNHEGVNCVMHTQLMS